MGIRYCALVCVLGLLSWPAGSARAQSGWADEDEEVEENRSRRNDDEDEDEESEDAHDYEDEDEDGDGDGDSDEESEEDDSDEESDEDSGEGDDEEEEDDEDEPDPKEPPKWFFGAFTRMVAVPTFMLELFLDAAPGVINASGGALVDYRTKSFIVEFGIGYTSYHFAGPYRAKGDPEVDTEYVDSTLGMVHLTGSMLWDAQFHKMFAFEYGFGLDLGVITGSMVRTEGYPTGGGEYAPCAGVGIPNPLYCEPTQSGGPTDAYDADGAHYGVTEERIPPIMAFPMIPHLALRFMPHRQVAVKLDFSYGIAQFTLGLSAFGGFDL